MADPIKLFRAVSGSQYVFFTSEEAEPVGITNKVVMSEKFTDASLITGVLEQNPTLETNPIIWSWNGTDISQFDSSYAKLRNVGWNSGALNVEPNELAPLGAYLVLTASGPGNGTLVWFASQSVGSSSFIMEAGLEEVSSSGGTPYGGLAMFGTGSGSDHYSIGILRQNGGTGWQFRFDGSSFSIPGDTPSFGGVCPCVMYIECIAEKVSGSIPTFYINTWANGQGSITGPSYGYDTTWASNWPNAWSSFTPEQMQRFGLGIQATGTANPATVKFSYITIRKHPIDQPETIATPPTGALALPSTLIGGTYWGRATDVRQETPGFGNDVEGIPNLLTSSQFAGNSLTASSLSATDPGLLTRISGEEAITFNLDGSNDETYQFRPGVLQNQQLLGSPTAGHTDWHFFLVFHVTESFSLNSGNVFENHRLVGNSNGNRWWGVYGRDAGSGVQEINPYFFSGSQVFTSHSINVGQVHLLEWWQTGSFSYSKLDNGLINSASGGRIDASGQSAFLLAGGEDSQFYSGSILEVYFASASNRVGATSNSEIEAVRNYYAARYDVSI